MSSNIFSRVGIYAIVSGMFNFDYFFSTIFSVSIIEESLTVVRPKECLFASIIKIIELLAESNKSWEDATQNAVTEASKSIRNIRSMHVNYLTAEVDKGEITRWRLNCKITFEKE